MLEAAGGDDGPGEGNLGVAVVQVPGLRTSPTLRCHNALAGKRDERDSTERCCYFRTWKTARDLERARLTHGLREAIPDVDLGRGMHATHQLRRGLAARVIVVPDVDHPRELGEVTVPGRRRRGGIHADLPAGFSLEPLENAARIPARVMGLTAQAGSRAVAFMHVQHQCGAFLQPSSHGSPRS